MRCMRKRRSRLKRIIVVNGDDGAQPGKHAWGLVLRARLDRMCGMKATSRSRVTTMLFVTDAKNDTHTDADSLVPY